MVALELLGRSDQKLPKLKEAYDTAKQARAKRRGPVGLHQSILQLYLAALVETGSAADAESLAAEMLAVAKADYPAEHYPDGHPVLAGSLNVVGTYLFRIGKLADSLECLQRAHDMRVRSAPGGGVDPVQVQLSKLNLAVILACNGRTSEAEDLAREAALAVEQLPASEKDVLPDEVLFTRYLVGRLSGKVQDELRPQLVTLAKRWDERANRMASSATRRESLLVLGRGSIAVEQLASLDRQTPESLEAIVQHFWCRRRLADQVITLKEASPRVRELDALIAERVTAPVIGDQTRQGAQPDLDQLIAEKEAEERKSGRVAVPLRKITMKDLAAALPEGAVHIELLHLPTVVIVPSDKPGQRTMTTVPHYYAVVIPRTGTPQLVRLPDQARVDEAAKKWLDGIIRGSDANHTRSTDVRDLVWRPIAAVLPKSAKTVYLAPDGLLGNIPWAALPADQPGQYLIDTFQFVTVPHGPLLHDLLTAKPLPAVGAKLLVVGGVEYGPELPASGDANRTRGWKGNYLPASLDEARAVGKQTGGAVLDGSTPTPARLKQELAGVTQLHIATHGFFDDAAFGKREEQIRTARRNWAMLPAAKVPLRDGGVSDCPLAFCGLVLAGANLAPSDDQLRGLLLGSDIAQQDLKHLRSVVLSGCQTATGGSIPGATTLTLQRAFHCAGCRNVVGSLWKVDDEKTSRFMSEFYRLHDGGKRPTAEALRATQLRLRETCKNPAMGVRDWAGFTISGAGD